VHHRDARRRENASKAAAKTPATDARRLVDFGCECVKEDCDQFVRVPLYVYRRVIGADGQYLVHLGHHPFERYRTIVTSSSMSIEELVRGRGDD
jgi:hypothetical protein